MKKLFAALLVLFVVFSFASISIAKAADKPLSSIVKVGEDVVVAEKTKIKDAIAIRGSVYVKGTVDGDVVAILGSVHLLPTARVAGDAVSVGGTVMKHEGAVVQGDIVQVGSGMQAALPFLGVLAVVGIAIIMLMICIGVVALALVVAAFFTKQVGAISSRIERSPWKALLWGTLGWILIIPIALLLALSIVGIPLIVVELILLSCALILGTVAASQLIGKKITQAIKRPNQPMLIEVVVGLLMIMLVGLLPVLGDLVRTLVATMGLGAAIMTRLGYQK